MRKVIISFVTLLLMITLVGCGSDEKQIDVNEGTSQGSSNYDYSKLPLLNFPMEEKVETDDNVIKNPFTLPLEEKEKPKQLTIDEFINSTNLILEDYQKGEIKLEEPDEERTILIPKIKEKKEDDMRKIIEAYNNLHKDDISCGLSFDVPSSEKENQSNVCESPLQNQESNEDEKLGHGDEVHEEPEQTIEISSDELRHEGDTIFREIPSDESFHVVQTNEFLYTVVNCNVRDYPGTMGTSKYMLYKYSPVRISGICDNGWYQIKSGGEVLYAPSEFFNYQDPVFINRDVTGGYKYSFLYNDGVSDDYVRIVEEGLDKLPKELIDEFETKGWKMFVSDRDITNMFWDGSSILGITLHDRHEIWISTRNQDPDTVVHEFGHFLDGTYYEGSSCEEFINIFKDEMNGLASIDNTCSANYNTPSEYFAEAYKLSIVDTTLLCANCPMTSKYMKDYLEN